MIRDADTEQPAFGSQASTSTNNSIEGFLQKLVSIEYRLANIERLTQETRQLVGPFGLPYPDGTILVQTIYGTKYFIEANDFVMTPQMVIYRQWESDLSHFFLSAVTEKTVFVDVGANIGYFTCLVASRIGPRGRGRVFAVEPNPKVFELLKRNASINWSMAPIEFFPFGASEAKSTAELFVPPSGAANASMSEIANTDTVTKHRIELRPLDDMLPKNLVVDLMKIDVEGFELFVLRGAKETIGRSPSIIIVMEWSLSQMRRAKCEPSMFFEFAEENGFGFFRVPERVVLGKNLNWNELRFDLDELKNTEYANVIVKRLQD